MSTKIDADAVPEPDSLVEIARKHDKSNADIPDRLYFLWLECLVATVRDADPKFNEGVELDRRRGTILRALERVEGISPKAIDEVTRCMDRFRLEDLYVPHRRPEPEVQLALDRGLGGLADLLVAPVPRSERPQAPKPAKGEEAGADAGGEDAAAEPASAPAEEAPAADEAPSVEVAPAVDEAPAPEGAEAADAESADAETTAAESTPEEAPEEEGPVEAPAEGAGDGDSDSEAAGGGDGAAKKGWFKRLTGKD